MIRLGQPKAAQRLPVLEPRQPLLLLRLGAIRVYRIHDEPALDGGEGAQTRIPALQLLHDETVRDVVEPGAAVALEGGAEDAHLAERLGGLQRECPRTVMLGHDGHELLLHPVADGIAHHPLLLGQQCLDAVVVDAAVVHRQFLLTRGWSDGPGALLRAPGSAPSPEPGRARGSWRRCGTARPCRAGT